MRRIALLLSLSALTACQPKSAGLSQADTAMINDMVGRYVSTTLGEDWDGWATQLSEDAVFLPPNGPVLEGRATIRQWIPVFSGLASFTAPVSEVTGDGSTAYARGTYTYATGPKAAVQGADSGKWITVYHRQADGSWRITRNMWNSNSPPPAPVVAKAPARRK
jgi:ketosteroid isomerase-like protein